jgi:hypothetical protein
VTVSFAKACTYLYSVEMNPRQHRVLVGFAALSALLITLPACVRAGASIRDAGADTLADAQPDTTLDSTVDTSPDSTSDSLRADTLAPDTFIGCPPGKLTYTGRDLATTTISAGKVVLADLDGDSRLDVLVNPYFKEPTGKIAVILNKGAGSFAAPVYYPTSAGTTLTSHLFTADMNSDKKVDVVALNYGLDYTGGSADILLGNGDGTLTAWKTLGKTITGVNPRGAAAADLNGDGLQDLLISCVNGDDRVGVVLQMSDGLFSRKQLYDIGDNESFVLPADFDGDGAIDFAVASDFVDAAIFVNDGQGGSFSKRTLANSDLCPRAAAGDFDQDGDVDLVLRCQGKLQIRLNDGQGNFTLGASVSAPGNWWLEAADLNGDGALDLVMLASKAHLAVALGKGDGTFLPLEVLAIGEVAHQIAIGDVSGDGQPDIVFGERSAKVVRYLEVGCK